MSCLLSVASTNQCVFFSHFVIVLLQFLSVVLNDAFLLLPCLDVNRITAISQSGFGAINPWSLGPDGSASYYSPQKLTLPLVHACKSNRRSQFVLRLLELKAELLMEDPSTGEMALHCLVCSGVVVCVCCGLTEMRR